MAWHEIVGHRKPIIQGVSYVIGGNSYRSFGSPGGGLCVSASRLISSYDFAYMSHINSLGRYGFGAIVIIFIIAIAFGAYIALSLVPSVFLRALFFFLFLVPILTAWKGYQHSLKMAQKEETKQKAWTYYIFGVLFTLLYSYGITWVLGYVLGLL